MSHKIVGVLVLVGLLGAVGFFYASVFRSVPIKALLDNPRHYEGRDITIGGEARGRATALGVGFFKIADETGSIIVFSSRPAPSPGTKSRIRGRLIQLIAIGPEQLDIFVEEECSRRWWEMMTYSSCKNDAARRKISWLATGLSFILPRLSQLAMGIP